MGMRLLWLKVAVSVVVYCLSVSAVPIYNKRVFSGGAGGVQKFPYPVATAFMQLGLVAAVLGLANIIGHYRCRPGGATDSWVFGPNLGYKLWYVGPVGVLFGFKYGITNWGLQLTPVGMHLLLQSTDLLWTVVLARLINKEEFGCAEWMAAMLSTAGSVLISLNAVHELEAPLVPLLVNLMTPLFLALCISTLRLGTQELMSDATIDRVTPVEFTALKLTLSALVALGLSFALESGTIQLEAEGGAAVVPKPAWWLAIRDQTPEGIALMLMGGVFVLVFQVNLTWMAHLTSALAVGIAGGFKVVPQWFINAAFNMKVDVAPSRLAGAALILLASALYTSSAMYKHRTSSSADLELSAPLFSRGVSPRHLDAAVPATSWVDFTPTPTPAVEPR